MAGADGEGRCSFLMPFSTRPTNSCWNGFSPPLRVCSIHHVLAALRYPAIDAGLRRSSSASDASQSATVSRVASEASGDAPSFARAARYETTPAE